LTITSPPYDNLRDYNGYDFDFESIARELFRVTKQGGIVVWIVGDATIKGSETGTSFRQALHFKEIGFNLHDTMIYQKKCYLPQNQHPRYSPTFEYMFLFCKGYPPKTFNPMREKAGGGYSKNKGQRNKNDKLRFEKSKLMIIGENKRRTNIWSYPTGGRTTGIKQGTHVAPFPEKLAEDHILSWSNEGDIVFDPMCGSGTTLKMAKKHNRLFVGCDISPEYCELAEKRIAAATQQLQLKGMAL